VCSGKTAPTLPRRSPSFSAVLLGSVVFSLADLLSSRPSYKSGKKRSTSLERQPLSAPPPIMATGQSDPRSSNGAGNQSDRGVVIRSSRAAGSQSRGVLGPQPNTANDARADRRADSPPIRELDAQQSRGPASQARTGVSPESATRANRQSRRDARSQPNGETALRPLTTPQPVAIGSGAWRIMLLREEIDKIAKSVEVVNQNLSAHDRRLLSNEPGVLPKEEVFQQVWLREHYKCMVIQLERELEVLLGQRPTRQEQSLRNRLILNHRMLGELRPRSDTTRRDTYEWKIRVVQEVQERFLQEHEAEKTDAMALFATAQRTLDELIAEEDRGRDGRETGSEDRYSSTGKQRQSGSGSGRVAEVQSGRAGGASGSGAQGRTAGIRSSGRNGATNRRAAG
jgi:hypothetical protein